MLPMNKNELNHFTKKVCFLISQSKVVESAKCFLKRKEKQPAFKVQTTLPCPEDLEGGACGWVMIGKVSDQQKIR